MDLEYFQLMYLQANNKRQMFDRSKSLEFKTFQAIWQETMGNQYSYFYSFHYHLAKPAKSLINYDCDSHIEAA